MCLQDDGDAVLWEEAGAKIQQLDISQCQATFVSDKEAILEYAQDCVIGGIAGLNDMVRSIAKNAEKRAQLMAAAVNGDIDILTDLMSEISPWRCVRGRTLTHVAAASGSIMALSFVLEHTASSQLDMFDGEGNSPLSVAARAGTSPHTPAIPSGPKNGPIGLKHRAL